MSAAPSSLCGTCPPRRRSGSWRAGGADLVIQGTAQILYPVVQGVLVVTGRRRGGERYRGGILVRSGGTTISGHTLFFQFGNEGLYLALDTFKNLLTLLMTVSGSKSCFG